MSYIFTISGEIGALVAAIFASFLMLLLYRHPNHAKWLEGELASTVTMLTLMAALIFSAAFLVQGLVNMGFDPLSALAIAAAIFAGVSWGFWKVLNIRARLQAAEEGRSPFRLSRKEDGRPRTPKGGPRGRMPTAA